MESPMIGRKIKRISTYLTVLGIVQLIGLNLGGVFWPCWAHGIRERRQSSRRWVLAFHSLYLAVGAYAIVDLIFRLDRGSNLSVFGDSVAVGRPIILAFLLSLVVIFGLPVLWLMSKEVKREFIEQADRNAVLETAHDLNE